MDKPEKDIVERLRQTVPGDEGGWKDTGILINPDGEEAAKEIETLREALERAYLTREIP